MPDRLVVRGGWGPEARAEVGWGRYRPGPGPGEELGGAVRKEAPGLGGGAEGCREGLGSGGAVFAGRKYLVRSGVRPGGPAGGGLGCTVRREAEKRPRSWGVGPAGICSRL